MAVIITATVERAATPGTFIGWVHVEVPDGPSFARCTDVLDNRFSVQNRTEVLLRTIVQTVNLFESPKVNDFTGKLPE